MSSKPVSKMARDIEERYYQIKLAIKSLFDQRLTGRVREGNSHKWHFLCHQRGDEPTLYTVDASAYIYDMTNQQLNEMLNLMQAILDQHLLAGGQNDFWATGYVQTELERGTFEAFTNLSRQSDYYAQQTTLAQLLSSPGYQNQVAAAALSTYSDWKSISDAARGDLASVVIDAVARGVNPRETAQVISKRLDVSMSKATTIAQTEQVGALRKAQRNEVDWSRERLGLNTAVLWMSALKPTTRPWHASRHGKVYTTEQVEEFYAVNGNRYNCYCSNIPVLLDDDGEIVNQGLVDKLTAEYSKWKSTNKSQ
ncbi:phage minor head protein [Erwiniaceae bacterium L1_54_3]|nr:phage minor head protein [Erwiniaceae bacterium L1_54_3]